MMMDKALIKMVKEHNAISGLDEFNRCLRFISMDLYNKEGYENIVKCYDGDTLTRYELAFSFKPKTKGENNIVKYQFNMYSDGQCQFYFDGTEYRA